MSYDHWYFKNHSFFVFYADDSKRSILAEAKGHFKGQIRAPERWVLAENNLVWGIGVNFEEVKELRLKILKLLSQQNGTKTLHFEGFSFR